MCYLGYVAFPSLRVGCSEVCRMERGMESHDCIRPIRKRASYLSDVRGIIGLEVARFAKYFNAAEPGCPDGRDCLCVRCSLPPGAAYQKARKRTVHQPAHCAAGVTR